MLNLKLITFTFILYHLQASSYSLDYESFEREKTNYIKEELFGSECSVKKEYHQDQTAPPTIFAGIFVRNKEFSLPYFLKAFQDLDYPKNRISLW